MKVSFTNPHHGRCWFTTESSQSSYGVPVLATEDGRVYGPGDSCVIGEGLEFLTEGLETQADVVRDFMEHGVGTGPLTDEQMEACRAFLAADPRRK